MDFSQRYPHALFLNYFEELHNIVPFTTQAHYAHITKIYLEEETITHSLSCFPVLAKELTFVPDMSRELEKKMLISEL